MVILPSIIESLGGRINCKYVKPKNDPAASMYSSEVRQEMGDQSFFKLFIQVPIEGISMDEGKVMQSPYKNWNPTKIIQGKQSMWRSPYHATSSRSQNLKKMDMDRILEKRGGENS